MIIQDGLQEFFKAMGFEDLTKLPKDQVEQLTKAFYSGCGFTFKHMADEIAGLEDKEAFIALSTFNMELVEYGKSIKES